MAFRKASSPSKIVIEFPQCLREDRGAFHDEDPAGGEPVLGKLLLLVFRYLTAPGICFSTTFCIDRRMFSDRCCRMWPQVMLIEEVSLVFSRNPIL